MALDERAQQELREIFVAELGEHCQVLTHAFLGLEKEPDAAEQQQLLGEAFRSAHSLKGAARAVGLGRIESLAHALEAVLAELQRGDLQLTPVLFDQLYAVVDGMALAERSAAETEPEIPVDDILRRLQAVQDDQAGVAPATQAPAASVPAPDGPSSMAAHHAPQPAVVEERPAARREPPARGAAAETIRL